MRSGTKRIGNARRGFSLIEVMIATAILMGSAIVLSKLAGMGREQSVRARLFSEAQQQCEQVLHEILLELRPLSPKSGEPLVRITPVEPTERSDEARESLSESSATAEPELPSSDEFPPETAADTPQDQANPDWRYSVTVDRLTELPGMWCLSVSVVQSDRTLRRPVRAELTRWIVSAGPAAVSGDGDSFTAGDSR